MRDFDRVKPEDRDKKLYFNKHEFIKISELGKKDPYGSIRAFEHYFEKYPDDNSARTYYITKLIAVGHLDRAKEELEQLEIRFNRNSLYHYDEERARMLNHNINLCKLKLFVYENRIEEALHFFYSNFDEFSYLGAEVEFYFRKLRGKIDPNRRVPNSYMFRQIVEYQEDDFRNHIKKHMADYNENDRNISVTYFNSDFPIDRVIEEVKKYIPSDKRLCYGFLEDMYVFKYEQCGRDTNKIVDYFKVFTFTNTQDFITMCPSSECENFPYVDLSYLKEKEEPKTLVKRPSQIDKFNKRYNR